MDDLEADEEAGGASKPKKSPAPKPPAAPRSLEPRGTHAALTQAPFAGDAHVVPGFGFTPQWGRLFAVGYPHLVLLVPDEIPDAKLDAACVDVLNKNPYDIEWAEGLARPLARLLARWAEAFKPGTQELSDAAQATLRDQRDITDTEARELLDASFSAAWTHYRYVRSQLLLLEALLGERATTACVDVLTALPTGRFTQHDVVLSGACWLLGLMLLRCTPAVRDALVAKLGAHFRTLAPDGLAPLATDESQAVYALDAVLHGAEGARRANPPGLGIGQLPFLTVPRTAALEAIRATAKVGPLATPPDVRRVFLAGPEALDVESTWVAGYTKVTSRAPELMLETYGQVDDARTVALVLALAKKKPLAKRAQAWFLEHAVLARPALEQLAKGGELAADAKVALAALG